MTNWKDRVENFVGDVETRLDVFRRRIQHPFSVSTVVITPYLGYVAQGKIYLHGRVLKDKGLSRGRADDTVLENLLNMYRRFETDEVPYAVVRAEFDAHVTEVTCDDEGYFDVVLPCDRPPRLEKAKWNVQLEISSLPDAETPDPAKTHTQAAVIVEPESAQFGIISDLDDTVMRTDVASLVEMARNTLFHNAHTRLPFDGVAAFYEALQKGGVQGVDHGFNPLFYVSSSPWNMYDLFEDFFEVRGIPQAPIFLRDFGMSKKGLLAERHESHKVTQIQRLLDRFPDLKFILIGDSGQRDPEIYREIVMANPNRILAIYIRSVTRGVPRRAIIKRLSSELQQQAVDMLLVSDTYEAAQHAAQKLFIDQAALDRIYNDAQEDKDPPAPLEEILSADQ